MRVEDSCAWQAPRSRRNCQSREYLEVLLDDVEDCAVVDLGDAHKIAHLAFVLDFLDALTSHQHAKETSLVILWPFLPNFGAEVEKSEPWRCRWL